MPLAVSDYVWQQLLRVEILIPVCALAVGAIAVVVNARRQIEQHRADVELKRDMVARGMSAEEIERVLAARSHENES